jgi:hypothetical protein
LFLLFATGVVDTSGKFAADVVDTGGNVIDTGGKFADGFVDTSGKFATISATLGKMVEFATGVVDTGGAP